MLVWGWLERSKVSGGWLGCRVSTGKGEGLVRERVHVSTGMVRVQG